MLVTCASVSAEIRWEKDAFQSLLQWVPQKAFFAKRVLVAF
jgi:hypothetical protein